jgi:hypothetical protein
MRKSPAPKRRINKIIHPRPASEELETSPLLSYSSRRVRNGLIITALGMLLFILGARPEWFGLNRSEVIGFVQIVVFELGLGGICLGGYIALMALWKKMDRTITVDFGGRLVSTGYVIALFTGMADVFGIGSQPLPEVTFFGRWQSFGVLVGQVIIAIGFLLLIPVPGKVNSSNPTVETK